MKKIPFKLFLVVSGFPEKKKKEKNLDLDREQSYLLVDTAREIAKKLRTDEKISIWTSSLSHSAVSGGILQEFLSHSFVVEEKIQRPFLAHFRYARWNELLETFQGDVLIMVSHKSEIKSCSQLLLGIGTQSLKSCELLYCEGDRYERILPKGSEGDKIFIEKYFPLSSGNDCPFGSYYKILLCFWSKIFCILDGKLRSDFYYVFSLLLKLGE